MPRCIIVFPTTPTLRAKRLGENSNHSILPCVLWLTNVRTLKGLKGNRASPDYRSPCPSSCCSCFLFDCAVKVGLYSNFTFDSSMFFGMLNRRLGSFMHVSSSSRTNALLGATASMDFSTSSRFRRKCCKFELPGILQFLPVSAWTTRHRRSFSVTGDRP